METFLQLAVNDLFPDWQGWRGPHKLHRDKLDQLYTKTTLGSTFDFSDIAACTPTSCPTGVTAALMTDWISAVLRGFTGCHLSEQKLFQISKEIGVKGGTVLKRNNLKWQCCSAFEQIIDQKCYIKNWLTAKCKCTHLCVNQWDRGLWIHTDWQFAFNTLYGICQPADKKEHKWLRHKSQYSSHHFPLLSIVCGLGLRGNLEIITFRFHWLAGGFRELTWKNY